MTLLRLLFITLFFVSIYPAKAQIIPVLASSFGIKEVPMKPSEIEGSEFFFEEPTKGNIVLMNDKTLRDQFFNVSLLTNEVYLESKGKLYVVLLAKVTEINLEDGRNYFVQELDNGSTKIYEPVIEGSQVSLFKGYFLEEKKPSYNVSHNVGRVNTIWTVKSQFFIRVSIEGKYRQLPEGKRKRSKFFLENFEVKAEEILNQNNYSLTKVDDLFSMIYNLNE